MSGPATCTRCGQTVLPILSAPPGKSDTWWRNQIGMTRRETTTAWVLRMRIFSLRWLPEHAADRLSETYTTLDLCDDCAAAVFFFAQNLPISRDGLVTS
jgi:hypothetical protein